jgi:hypothetical protein
MGNPVMMVCGVLFSFFQKKFHLFIDIKSGDASVWSIMDDIQQNVSGNTEVKLWKCGSSLY